MVKLTREEKKMYQIFSLLMGSAIGANITTAKQISIYVVKSTSRLNVANDCTFNVNDEDNCYELLLSDGRKISFSRNSNEFGFIISKDEKYVSRTVRVYERILGNLTTLSVYGEVKIKDNGMYVISFRPADVSDDSLKFAYINYYTDDEINWIYDVTNGNIDGEFDVVAKRNLIYPLAEERAFVVTSKYTNSFDCFNEILSNVVSRIDLLCDNVKVIEKYILKRKLEN